MTSEREPLAVSTRLAPDEPPFGPWSVVALAEFVAMLGGAARRPDGLPRIVAIDGRSSSGKTTLAGRITAAVPAAVAVHTDDIAWAHSRFGWADPLIDGVLHPLRRGQTVSYRPPAWESKGRTGSIEVSTTTELVVIEGVGASRREVADFLDASVWVQADLDVIAVRNAARAAAGESRASGQKGWMAEEFPFLERDRPWKRVTVITAGSDALPHPTPTGIVVAAPH
jgi:hypothetical protein